MLLFKSIKRILMDSKVCKPMNDPDSNNDGYLYWLNPNNQKCFNYGWFTKKDFADWTKGTGPIVKGNTEEEKKKYWDVAVFESENAFGWAIGYYKKWFHLIDETYYRENSNGKLLPPLKITKSNHGEIISKAFASVVRWYADTLIKPNHNNSFWNRMQDELTGICQTLYILGVGYYASSNTPEDPENLSWIKNVTEAKAMYLYYIKNKIELPDFDFVYGKEN